MPIKDEGFLAKEIENWRKVHVGRNKEWFALAAEMNRLGHELWNGLPESGDEDQWFFTARLLFLRGMMSFQSAVILVTHGLTVDAGTIARSVFEDLFCLAASKNDEALVKRLIGAHTVTRRKIARAVSQIPRELGVEPEKAQQLKDYADQLGDEGQTLNFAEIAEAAGLKPMYDVFYRSLSNNAAHPTLDSLERLMRTAASGEIESFFNGPDAPDVDEMISLVCVAGFNLLDTAAQIFENKNVHERTLATFQTYKKLAAVTHNNLAIPELR
jgi:hypothetical protein